MSNLVKHQEVEFVELTPKAAMQRVTDVASATRAIVEASAMTLGNRKFVRVEGWLAIATAHGCTVSADLVESVDGGIRAVATVRRLLDGVVLGQAEGFVGNDERSWVSRPLYARRAMAQTRANSRACRTAFAHVIVAMNAAGAKLETTPAEEVPEDGFERKPSQPQPIGESLIVKIASARDLRELSALGAEIASAKSRMPPEAVEDLRAAYSSRKAVLTEEAAA